MFKLLHFKDNIACIAPSGEHLSYSELQAIAERIQSKTMPHQLVFSICGNTVGSLAGYVSFVNNNDATLMLDAHMERSAFDALYNTYQPRYIWAPEDFDVPKEASLVHAEREYQLW